MAKRISALIVIYDKNLSDSETLRSLSHLNFNNLNIVIVNNGPQYLLEDEFYLSLERKFVSVALKNFTINKPLSWVYNDFINDNDSDRYIILDDDTVLTSDYFERLVFSNEEYMLGLPIMVSRYDKKQYTPFFNGEFKTDTRGNISGNFNFSITSALVLSREIINVIKKRFGTIFDECFALYNIDNSLFIRLETIAKEGIAIVTYLSNVSLLHDFSNIDSVKEPQWRTEEKMIAQTISIKRYFKGGYRQIIKQVFFKMLKLEFRNCYLIVRTFVEGKHPRCKQRR
jgi:hypothetical protein